LLNYFGSVDNIASASVQEIAKVPGISIQVAEQIYQFMHGVK
jgi:excinuclease UvrABC nuclease subunit